MIARLALVERGIPFASVKVDIHRRMQQLAPDYARLNPNLTVPTLEIDGRMIAQSRDILLLAFGVTEAALGETTRGWIDRHYAFPIDELTFGWLLSWNPLARPAVLRSLTATEKRLRELATEHPDLADVYGRRAEVFAGRVKTFDPDGVKAMFGERKRAAFQLLDVLEDALGDGRETLVPDGYGPADVVWTVFLARMGFVRFRCRDCQATTARPLREGPEGVPELPRGGRLGPLEPPEVTEADALTHGIGRGRDLVSDSLLDDRSLRDDEHHVALGE